MKQKRKMCIRVLTVLCILLCVCGLENRVRGESFRGVPVSGDYEIPDTFDIAVSATCSGHNFFEQVSAREDGSYLVVYRQSNNPVSDTIFGAVYIDVFAPDGSFMYELTFNTSFSCIVEYTQEKIVMYFYDHIIVYDPITGVCQGYRTEAEAAMESGVYALQEKKFSSGQWEYTCTNTFFNRTGLIRTDGTVTQELLSLPGTGLAVWNTLVPAVLLGTAHIFVGILLLRRLNRKRGGRTSSTD